MITKLIILYLLIMFFSFRIPSQKSKRGLKRKKLQERTPVVFHLHNLLDTVFQSQKKSLSHFCNKDFQKTAAIYSPTFTQYHRRDWA